MMARIGTPHRAPYATLHPQAGMSCNPRQSLKVLIGGLTALVIAMGISRFAYTPLLPIMQSDAGLTDELAGYLASINYAGYLLGALWLIWRPPGNQATKPLRQQLLLNIASTLCMGLTSSYPLWSALRFVGGFSSAMIFVLASGVVLQHLALHQRQSWSGWLYSAIGIGIILSAIVVPPLGSLFGWRVSWFSLALLSFLLAYPAYHWLEPHHPPPTAADHAADKPRGRHMLPWLTAAYFCAGFGYIITGTFLVTMLKRMPGLENSSTLAWLIVGLAAAPSSILWMKLGLRFGAVKALIAAYIVQALGITLPVLSASLTGNLLGAACYGGTFMGIVTLSMHCGRTLTPESPHRTIGILTAAFGAGQILGPAIAGLIASHTQSFTPALYVAALVIILGALCLAWGALHDKGQAINH